MARIARREILRFGGAGLALLVGQGSRLARAADTGPIRLGFAAPLSGVAQLSGDPTRIGAEAARDWINAHGGVMGRPIELVVRDDKGSPTESVGQMRELSSSGMNLLLGAMLTGTALAVQPIIPTLNAVYISTGSADERLTHELFNRNSFTTSSSIQMRIRAFADVLGSNYPEVTTWGSIFSDNAVGHDSYAVFKAYIQRYYADKLHKEVMFLEPQMPKFGATDYKSQISALMASPVQGLYHNLFGADGITFLQQAKPFGLFDKVKVIADQGEEFNVGKVLGKAMPPNDWTMSYGYWQGRRDNQEGAFLSKYFVDKTGDQFPSGLAYFGYSAVKAYAAAIEQAKSTETMPVIDALERVKFTTCRGAAYFRKEDHRIIDDVDIVKLGPKDSAPFWEVKNVVSVPGASVIDPPTPGQPVAKL